MWHTSKGDRILTGAEAELFRLGAEPLFVHVSGCGDDSGGWPTGVSVFDELRAGQKLAMLCDVTKALLLEMEPMPMPRLTALSEATVAAVYGELLGEIEAEIEFQNGTELRQAVIDVLEWANRTDNEDFSLPDAGCEDMETWDDMVDFCMDRIHWDRDFEMEYLLDAPPDQAAAERKFLRIEDDYFTAIPPDPTDEQIKQYADVLQRLLVERRSARR